MKEEDTTYNDRHHRPHGPIGALILIGIGTIFLLNNLGFLPLDVWQNLWRFWPAILILIGLQLILGRNPRSNFIVLIVGLIFIGLIVLISLAPTNPGINSWFNQYMPGMMQRYQTNPWDFQNMNQNMYRHMYQDNFNNSTFSY